MSFATQAQTTDSQDSTANNAENDDFAPQPITSRYVSVQTLHRLVKDAIGSVDDFSMSDTDLPAVRYAQAIEARLYSDDGCLGELQKEVDYTTGDFKDQFGDSITTEHADLTQDERAELKELFRDSKNHDVEDVKTEFKLPVVNGERLPVLVADHDVADEAIEMLDEILAEFHNDASGTTSDVEDSEFPVLEGTLDDLEAHLASEAPDVDTLREMIEVEQDNKDRKGANDLLTSAIDARDEESDEEPEADDHNDASGTTSDVDAEEIATAVTTAVLEALDN